jgi:hypothetical protein
MDRALTPFSLLEKTSVFLSGSGRERNTTHRLNLRVEFLGARKDAQHRNSNGLNLARTFRNSNGRSF